MLLILGLRLKYKISGLGPEVSALGLKEKICALALRVESLLTRDL